MKQIQSFFLGIIAAIGALFLEVILVNFSQPLSIAENEFPIKELFSFGYVFFMAVIIEEILKVSVIYKAVPKQKNIVFNSLFFGLGFSALEAALVFWNNGNEITDILGILGIFMVHTSTSLLFGYSVQNTKRTIFGLFPVFITAAIIHSSYNIAKISEVSYQKQLIFYILVFLLLLDIFMLIKSSFKRIESEPISQ